MAINWWKILIEESVNIVVQINGKTRGIINAKKDVNEEEILFEIKKDLKISNHLKDKIIKKKIFIPQKLINIVVSWWS